MPLIDDDPVTPDAVNGVFADARELGRPARVFTIAVAGADRPHAIDRATLLAVETLGARTDISACAGSITVLMSGETAGVVVAQPQGAPTLKALGESLVQALAEQLDRGSVQISVGMATTLEHKDLSIDDAIAVAMEGLEVASASGSHRAVHSELYELTLASHRRKGTVFPLESVQHFDDDVVIPRPPAAAASEAPVADAVHEPAARAPEAAEPSMESIPVPASSIAAQDHVTQPAAETLGEFDDPFAHLASEAYELGADSAAALTNGIAPRAEVVAKLEQESRAEIERLRLELELARREKAEAAATGDAIDKQERRISKLLHQLEDAESEIARLRSEKEEDPGVPSQFRAVQGLDPKEPEAPVKRVLIDGVFESNRGSKSKKRKKKRG